MTDKELLELAAKAAGMPMRVSSDGDWYADKIGTGYFGYWNPLTDDGDALRLAVKLKLPMSYSREDTGNTKDKWPDRLESWVNVGKYWHSNDSRYYPHAERYEPNPCAATRRAIVRAAAEIGKENEK